jgi:hypothetical protein
MYLAEIRGKLSSDIENKEDVLTSNVFSFFKYAPRKIFLSEFLKLIDIEVSKNELLEAEFIFWPSYEDGTEPDLVIIVGQFYLLIEAKYFSGFGQENDLVSHQLEREFNNGYQQARLLGKKFVITTITTDLFNKPRLFENIDQSIKNELCWINWHRITKIIEDVLLSTKLAKENYDFAKDLFQLLQKKGFRNFIGIERLTCNQKINQNSNRIFFDISTVKLLDVFKGFSQIYEEELLNELDDLCIYFIDKRKMFDFQNIDLIDIDNEIFYRRINGKERDY